MCLFSHEWKVKSTDDIKPLYEYWKDKDPNIFAPGQKFPIVYLERKLQILRECAKCGAEEVQIKSVDP